MINIIVACDESYGIGIDGKLPWKISEEMKLFKATTFDSVLIVGRKTAETLPRLVNRVVIALTRTHLRKDENNCVVQNSIHSALEYAMEKYPNKKIFIAGGAQIYKQIFSTELINKIDSLYISFVKGKFVTDTRLEINLKDWSTYIKENYTEFEHHIMKYTPQCEGQYLNLLKEILNNGVKKIGRNGETRSLFVKHFSFDLTRGFPLLTTKKMFFRGIVEELLFFLRGDTNTKILEEKGINIWKGNTERKFLDSLNMLDRDEGVMGPMYGYQWRHFNAPYNEKNAGPLTQTYDQLSEVIKQLKTDSSSRRILMTDFNPLQAAQGVLYPCHSIIIQFYANDGFLDMFCYNRSQDLFLGVPFNIASSALLLCIIGKCVNLTPRMLNITMGDVHIYAEHYDVVEKQISSQPYLFPTLKINKEIKDEKDIETLTFSDFILENYISHETIKAKMVA